MLIRSSSPFLIRLKQKAQYIVELKLHYPLMAKVFLSKRAGNRVESTLFIYAPNQLSNAVHGTDKEFFLRENLQANLRFSTPHFSLEDLLVLDDEEQLLYRLSQSIKRLPRRNMVGKVKTQILLLSSVFVVSFNEYIKNWSDSIQLNKHKEDNIDACFLEFHKILKQLIFFLEKYRRLKSSVLENGSLKNGTYEKMKSFFISGDRRFFLFLQIKFSNIIRQIELMVIPESKEKDLFLKNVTNFLEKEQEYGKNQGYLELPEPKDQEQTGRWVSTLSQLKKWAQSVLYLNIVPKKTPDLIFQIVASFAAAIAMSFALLAQIYATTQYQTFSYTWILIMVISYVFKDRMKESLRVFFSKNDKLPVTFYEYADIVSETTSKRMGKLRSFVKYTTLEQINEPVISDTLKRSTYNFYNKYSHLLVYKRNIFLNKNTIVEQGLTSSLSDIIQFDLSSYCQFMDSSRKTLDFYHQDIGVYTEDAKRVYFLYLFVCLKINNEKYWSRYRIALNPKRILEIKEVKDKKILED